jgi:hypothetical protein
MAGKRKGEEACLAWREEPADFGWTVGQGVGADRLWMAADVRWTAASLLSLLAARRPLLSSPIPSCRTRKMASAAQRRGWAVSERCWAVAGMGTELTYQWPRHRWRLLLTGTSGASHFSVTLTDSHALVRWPEKTTHELRAYDAQSSLPARAVPCGNKNNLMLHSEHDRHKWTRELNICSAYRQW